MIVSFSFVDHLSTRAGPPRMNPQLLIPEKPLSTLTVPQYALCASYYHSRSSNGSPITRITRDMEEDFNFFEAYGQQWAADPRIDYTGVQLVPLIFHYDYVNLDNTTTRKDTVLLLNAVQLGNAASDVPFPPQVQFHWTPLSAAWHLQDGDPRWDGSIKTLLEAVVNFTLRMALGNSTTAGLFQREVLTESTPISAIYDPMVTEYRVPDTAQSALHTSQPQRTRRCCAMFGIWRDMVGIRSNDPRVSRWFTEEEVRSETQMCALVQRGILAAFEARRGDTGHGQSCGLMFGQMSY
ncbi:hypothetical protein BDV97DRAFT_366615 [Delphinella strobiligena]|nr:hypothetical protein BDV97DRAFT_366615 [Delphinella strobiligena]